MRDKELYTIHNFVIQAIKILYLIILMFIDEKKNLLKKCSWPFLSFGKNIILKIMTNITFKCVTKEYVTNNLISNRKGLFAFLFLF